MEEVILVNELDEELGLMEKLEAHEKGLLHRAFSVFVFNDKGQVMLQRRAFSKYHSGGLWTNTCCSHPRKGESTEDAAHRRLMEEMGFDCPLEEVLHFIYRAELDNGLTEHELDHVLVGNFNDDPQINPEEVAEWKWMFPDDISREMKVSPDQFTEWFKIIFDRFISTYKTA